MKSSRCRKIKRGAAMLLASGLLTVYVGIASAAPLMGKLKTGGSKPIIVNGYKVASGTAIFSGSQIQSPAGVGATVELGALGRLDIAPRTEVTLTFSEGNVAAELKSGYVVLTTRKGVKGSVRTPDGKLAQTDITKLSSVIARTAGSAGPEASVPIGAAAGGIGAGTAAGVGAAGAAVVGGAAAARGNGRGRDLSPTTPRQP
jgi:hypothetical protein